MQKEKIPYISHPFSWIMGAALVLYLQQAWVQGFFQDGYLYAALGKHAASQGHWLVNHLTDATYREFFHHTPFVFILEGLFFKLFGASYLSARIFSALFPLVTLMVLYKWIKKEKGEVTAFLVCLFFIFLPPVMKKVRFPGMDMPLMLFTLVSIMFYYRAYAENLKKYWLGCGIFFGLALLTKGPMAFFIPLAILLHLLWTRKLRLLASITPWGSLLLGFMIFSLWPLSLKLTGQFDIFEKYFYFTFVHTVAEGRGVSEFTFFQCLIFLIKQTAPWLILTLFSIYLALKVCAKDDLLKLFISLWVAVFVPLSLVKFKYSHYMMPMYPAYAFLAAYPISFFSKDVIKKIYQGFVYVTIIVTLGLLIFPLTTEIRRDSEIFEIRKLIELMPIKPNTWGIVNDAYPFWALTNLNAFHDHSNTHELTTESLLSMVEQDDGKNWIFLIPSSVYQNHFDLLDVKLKKLIYFEKQDMIVAIERSVFDDNLMFIKKRR